ncbi:MAG: hypothetical protein U5Q03_14965 [Bacteroidota bacterium]|nr:hypothetical protein [Bacteroidota bacterium]
MELMWQAAWVLRPAGNAGADSFRMWEGLEAGAVPILDATTPHGDPDVWSQMLGNHPFHVLRDWGT